jgi:hypothetical protein
MRETTLVMSGIPIPGFWSFVFIHPWLTFWLGVLLIISIFGTITDVLIAWSKRK